MVTVKEDFQIEIERKNQEIAAVKEEFRREMEKKEKSMNEEFKKKDQEIAAIKEEFRKQVDREEQVTEKKLAEQKKVCCNISVQYNYMYYMMCPYLVSGVYQQDGCCERGFPERARNEGAGDNCCERCLQERNGKQQARD